MQNKGFGIVLASDYGMCFGVRDAISLNEKRARSAEQTILGELVHKEDLRKEQTLK